MNPHEIDSQGTARRRQGPRAATPLALAARTALPLLAAVLTIGLGSAPAQANPCQEHDEWGSTHFGFGEGRKGVTVSEAFDKRIPASRGVLKVEGGENGAISLRGWDADEGFVCAKIYAWGPDEESARAVARQVRIVADERGVRAEGPEQTKRSRWAVAYRIYVPRDTDVEARVLNGPISVADIRSRLDLVSVNGPISITAAGGDVRGRTTNGPVDVALAGTRWQGKGLDVESTNGPVTVTVPERYSADLEFGTVNGPVEFDFPITVQGRVSKTFKATLGSGGPPIRVFTTNGPATLRRG